MGYIPGFQYDIFISYAHVDNLEGWVKQFHEALTVKLAQRFGRQGLLNIWYDESLMGDELFDSVIENRISQSAIFLALNSIGYNQSDYCKQEIHWFYNKATRDPYGVRVGERMRFVNVCLYDIPYTEWPEEFGRTSGFKFFDKAANAPLEFNDSRYRTQVNELGKAIYQNLAAFKAHTESAAPPAAPAIDGEPKVFLAASTLRSIRTRVKSELEQKGIEVYEEMPPPDRAEAHELAVKDALANALLSVHLLDHRRGEEIDGDEATTYPLKQLELGRQMARSHLIWVPKTTEIEAIADDSQKTLLLALRDQERDITGRFVHGLDNEIPDLIVDLLDELKHREQARSADQPPPAVLLDTHLKDSSLTMAVSRYLLEQIVRFSTSSQAKANETMK